MSRLVVISGCSGGGKSTLLCELARRGHLAVDEPGRRVVERQLASGGDALPWADAPAFAAACADLATADLVAASQTPDTATTFFDRSLVDAAIAIRHYTGSDATTISRDSLRAYHRHVFFTPPWASIWSADDARRHSFAEATAEYDRLVHGYTDLGYQITVLPYADVNDRADQILGELGMASTRARQV